MIDFLKILITDKVVINELNNNPLLIWYNKKDSLKSDYEVIQSQTTKIYKGIYFCFYSEKLEILFKPHYYFNDNKHNANDFKALDCINAIAEVLSILNILEPEKLRIINLEYGLNLISPIDIKDLITFIYAHGKNEFITDRGFAFSKKAYTPTRKGGINWHKIIKAYAKSIQYPQYSKPDLLRFEVKSKRSKYINSLGIYHIGDLLRLNVYETLTQSLINEFMRVLIIDGNAKYNNLTKNEIKSLKQFQNTNYWYKIKQSETPTNRNRFARRKKRYFELLDKTKNNIHNELLYLIKNKLEYLKSGAYSAPPENVKSGAYSSIYIKRNCTNSDNKEVTKYCPVTNVDISIQKDNSILLSNTGLKYLETNDKEQFNIIKNTFLTGANNKYERSIYSMISKQIRNRYNNNRFKYSTPTLFDLQ